MRVNSQTWARRSPPRVRALGGRAVQDTWIVPWAGEPGAG